MLYREKIVKYMNLTQKNIFSRLNTLKIPRIDSYRVFTYDLASVIVVPYLLTSTIFSILIFVCRKNRMKPFFTLS